MFRLAACLTMLFLAGCQSTSKAPAVTTSTEELQQTLVEIRVKTKPADVRVYSSRAIQLGSSGPSGEFTTNLLSDEKVILHFNKDNYVSQSLELNPKGLIEIHYINLEAKLPLDN